MSKNSGKGCSLLTGIAIGAGVGILFAPKKGSETRKELTIKINEPWDKVKELEYDDVKKSLEKKIKELKKELADLDQEKVASVVKEKAKMIQIKAEELYNMAVEKGTPVLEKAADDVRKKTVEVLNKAIDAIEKPEPKKLAKNK